MKTESKAYYEARERAERAAAENATCPGGQQAYDEMARAYAKLAENGQPDEQRPTA